MLVLNALDATSGYDFWRKLSSPDVSRTARPLTEASFRLSNTRVSVAAQVTAAAKGGLPTCCRSDLPSLLDHAFHKCVRRGLDARRSRRTRPLAGRHARLTLVVAGARAGGGRHHTRNA
jgi:hypothetical protein